VTILTDTSQFQQIICQLAKIETIFTNTNNFEYQFAYSLIFFHAQNFMKQTEIEVTWIIRTYPPKKNSSPKAMDAIKATSNVCKGR